MMDFAFDILRATEAAAIAASDYIGYGDKNKADLAATVAMRLVLDNIEDFGARIVIGEGKKDNAPGLFEGEILGKGELKWAIGVDPLDGTSQTAKGGPGAMSVITVGGRDALFATDNFYMKKLAYGQKIAEVIHRIENPVLLDTEDFLREFKKKNTEFHTARTVCMLDRPRHAKAIELFHQYHWRVRLIQDCDVSAAIGTALPDSGVDLYYGIGGAPEGVIAAAALRCLGGHFEGTLVNDKWENVSDVLSMNKLASGNTLLVSLTGVTDGGLLKGVNADTTHSLLIGMYEQRKICKWITSKNVVNAV